MLGNSDAQVSRMDISGVSNGDGYHMVNGGGYDNGAVTERQNGGGLSAKAGIILVSRFKSFRFRRWFIGSTLKGIHNISIVIPQFLVTGFSSLIFAIFDPQNTGVPQHHGAPVHAPIANGTDVKVLATNVTESLERMVRGVALKLLETRQELAEEDGSAAVYQGSNSVVYIFRFGGIAATIAAVLAWRLARDLRHR